MTNNFKKISLVLSVMFFILFSFVFLFLYKKTNENNQKAEEARTVFEGKMKERDDLQSLERSLKKIELEKTSIDKHFVKSSDIVSLLDTVEKLALKVGAVAQIKSVITPDNASLAVELKAEGSFESLYKFLALLENSPYEIDFLSMDLQKPLSASQTVKNAKDVKWEALFKLQILSFTP